MPIRVRVRAAGSSEATVEIGIRPGNHQQESPGQPPSASTNDLATVCVFISIYVQNRKNVIWLCGLMVKALVLQNILFEQPVIPGSSPGRVGSGQLARLELHLSSVCDPE